MALLARLTGAVLLLAMLGGASNSSNSVFIMRFPSPAATSEALTADAISQLEASGFHQSAGGSSVRLQYRSEPVWADVSSPASGQLRLAFSQFRAGCGRIPEVGAARELMPRLRASLEARYGPAVITERHAANAEADLATESPPRTP